MPSLYILNGRGKVVQTIKGDDQTVCLNIPENAVFTTIEPENMYEQLFNFISMEWVYPDQ